MDDARTYTMQGGIIQTLHSVRKIDTTNNVMTCQQKNKNKIQFAMY